jgi:hypothetical protein
MDNAFGGYALLRRWFSPTCRSMHWMRVSAGAFYLACVWVDGVGSNYPARILPQPAAYFVQIATLFPYAAVVAIDYRAEGWRCSDRRWQEIDTRPNFRMHADDKENRFYRVMHFYRSNRKTMVALDQYLVDSHNASSSDRIGGVRLLSLRIPLPEPGAAVPRWSRRPVSEFHGDQRHDWYWTPASKRDARCESGVQ